MARRAKFIVGIGIIVSAVAALVYSAVDQTKMYMVTVAEFLGDRQAYAGTTVRVAGRVHAQSMQWNAEARELRFTLDDLQGAGSIPVRYTGLLPDMFAEGRDVVVEGAPVAGAEVFEADTVLTSCPSKYAAEAEAKAAAAKRE
jgi:cytochrome c-type biogenesis protein CcmE